MAVTLLCVVLQWWTRVITHWLKPTERARPRANPSSNYRLREIMMCQRRFISGDSGTTLMKDVESGEAVCVQARR